MDKYIRYDSENSLGQCFAEALDVTRRGAGFEKIAGKVQPEMAAYIKSIRPSPQYQYVLMTPMGSLEYWGQNVNGDLFPELSLAFNRERDNPAVVVKALEAKWLTPFGLSVPPGNYTQFGHKSFLEALRYRHHVNKNPDISYGDITMAIYNQDMHRVEVIARHDREKAKRVGAEDIIKDLDEGRPRQISMGCRVPFDVCTICGHMSKTPTDYCEHLRSMMGSIMPDGRVVGAVNFFPRFFDLSDVFIPAAKEAGVLLKVANAQRFQVGTPKVATQRKVAELTKELLPNSGRKAIEDAVACEGDLPRPVLRAGNFDTLLSSLAAMGIMLKPREFQDGMLSRMGQPALADSLWDRKQVFAQMPTSGPPAELSQNTDFGLMRLLQPLLRERSGFNPYLPERVLRVTIMNVQPGPSMDTAPYLGEEASGLLQKISHVYSAYRQSLRNLPQHLELAVQKDFGYYENNFFSELLTDSLVKQSSVHHGGDLSPTTIPMYFYGAYRDGAEVLPRQWNFEVQHNSPVRALLGSVF